MSSLLEKLKVKKAPEQRQGLAVRVRAPAAARDQVRVKTRIVDMTKANVAFDRSAFLNSVKPSLSVMKTEKKATLPVPEVITVKPAPTKTKKRVRLIIKGDDTAKVAKP